MNPCSAYDSVKGRISVESWEDGMYSVSFNGEYEGMFDEIGLNELLSREAAVLQFHY